MEGFAPAALQPLDDPFPPPPDPASGVLPPSGISTLPFEKTTFTGAEVWLAPLESVA